MYKLESVYKGFVRSGALLSSENKEILKKISNDLSIESLKFSQNLLAETNASYIVI
jgi:peptidyl-dipeptidase Dcp